jgi:hypothetical protein
MECFFIAVAGSVVQTDMHQCCAYYKNTILNTRDKRLLLKVIPSSPERANIRKEELREKEVSKSQGPFADLKLLPLSFFAANNSPLLPFPDYTISKFPLPPDRLDCFLPESNYTVCPFPPAVSP